MDYFNDLEKVLENAPEFGSHKLLAFTGNADEWYLRSIHDYKLGTINIMSFSQRKTVALKRVKAQVFVYSRWDGGHWREVMRNTKGLYFFGIGGNTPIYFDLKRLPKEML